MEYEYLREQLQKKLGPIHNISQIAKGFSNEEKYKIETETNIYLLRLSPLEIYSRKLEEFEIMKKVYKNGVKCNKPFGIFKHEEQKKVYGVFSYLPGYDAEDTIARIHSSTQYEMGFHTGQDLKRINCLTKGLNTWKQRRWEKHERYLKQYYEQDYRFSNDDRVFAFIDKNYDKIESNTDYFQHDDFHLGNIIINDEEYVGILDFNRYDWGDPLHEFVKLEWFTWPVSKEFARGQIEGYFGNKHINGVVCLQICIYLAMSILSTIVWTLKFHPHTMTHIERRMYSILDHYRYFDNVNPLWAM